VIEKRERVLRKSPGYEVSAFHYAEVGDVQEGQKKGNEWLQYTDTLKEVTPKEKGIRVW